MQAQAAIGTAGERLPALFGEGVGGFVVSGSADALARIARRAPIQVIGAVGGRALQITAGEETLELELEAMREAHGALAPLFP